MSTNHVRLLLIEDEEDDVYFVRRLLERLEDFEVELEHAPDGDEALERLGRGGIDVVFLDNRLVRWTGVEVLREMRARGLNVPTMLCSTLLSPQAERELSELGCDAIVAKGDLSIDSVREALSSLLGS